MGRSSVAYFVIPVSVLDEEHGLVHVAATAVWVIMSCGSGCHACKAAQLPSTILWRHEKELELHEVKYILGRLCHVHLYLRDSFENQF